MLAPVFITRSVQVESVKGDNHLVSTAFIARFQDGSEKVLTRKSWDKIGLLRDCDLGERTLSASECALYYRDWAKNPIFGEWGRDYPSPSTIPEEILELL